MRKTFVSNLLLLVAVNLLIKPFYLLGIEAEIQDRTGPEAFGSYFALINFSYLLNILPDLGVTNWNTRRVASQPGQLPSLFPVLLSVRGLMSMGYLVLVLLCGLLLGYSSSQMGILALLAGNQVLASALLYLRSNLAGLHLFRQDSLLSVLDRAILVVFMAALLWWPGSSTFQMEWLVWGQTVAYGLSVIAALALVARHAGGIRFRWDGPQARRVLRESMPFALLILLSGLALRTDSVLLERIDTARAAGDYAMGFRFFDAVTMVAFLFAGLLLPIFSRMHERAEAIAPLLGTAFRIMSSGLWILACCGVAWPGEILAVFYRNPTPDAVHAFSILMVGCAAFSMQYVYGTLLTAMGALRALVGIAAVALGINLILNLALIPHYGAVGSALANVGAQTTALVLQVIFVHRLVKPAMARDYRRLFVFAACSAAILAAILSGAGTIKALAFPYGAAVFISLSLLVAMGTRVLDFRAFLNLLKMKE